MTSRKRRWGAQSSDEREGSGNFEITDMNGRMDDLVSHCIQVRVRGQEWINNADSLSDLATCKTRKVLHRNLGTSGETGGWNTCDQKNS